jgi:PTS system nitrogen regulatory IIA component
MTAKPVSQEIMTLAELANYLKVAEKTVVRMAREGKIPGTKVASQWRFMRSMVDQWLENRMQQVNTDNMFELMKMAPEVVPVSRLVSPDLMMFDIKPGSIPEVLEQLASPLQSQGMVDNSKKYLQLLIERENLHSTAIAPHVAIPHARTPADSTLKQSALIVGICPEGTDFGADDKLNTHVFLLICSEDDMVHLRLLAKISKLLSRPKVIDRLSQCTSSEQVIGLLAETEWKLAIKQAGE